MSSEVSSDGLRASEEVEVGDVLSEFEVGDDTEFEVGDDTYQARRPLLAPRRPDYSVTVDRTGGKPLGITYDYSDGEKAVIKDMQPGLLYEWHRTAEQDSWVLLGDSIVAANGVEGDVELVIQECLKHGVLHLKLRPPDVDPEVPPVCLTRDPRVFVHVYDLFEGAAVKWLNDYWPRKGIFHTGVEVYGREWFFCGTEGVFHGVYSVTPRRNPRHVYRKSVLMGHTMLDASDFTDLMPMIRIRWPGWTYHVTERNCHTFTNFLCKLLGFPAGPAFGLFAPGDTAHAVGKPWNCLCGLGSPPGRAAAQTACPPRRYPSIAGCMGPRRDGPSRPVPDPTAGPRREEPNKAVPDPAAGPRREEPSEVVPDPAAGPRRDKAKRATM